MYEYVLSNHYEAPGTTNMKLLFQIITILLNVPKYNSMKKNKSTYSPAFQKNC